MIQFSDVTFGATSMFSVAIENVSVEECVSAVSMDDMEIRFVCCFDVEYECLPTRLMSEFIVIFITVSPFIKCSILTFRVTNMIHQNSVMKIREKLITPLTHFVSVSPSPLKMTTTTTTIRKRKTNFSAVIN